LLHYVTCVKTAAIGFEIKLVPRNGKKQVFPVGCIRPAKIIVTITKLYVQDVGGLHAPFQVFPDIDKGVSFAPGHGDVQGAKVYQALFDQDVQRGDGVIFLQVPVHLLIPYGVVEIIETLPELLCYMILYATGILPRACNDVEDGIAILPIRDHVLKDGAGVVGYFISAIFVEVRENAKHWFPGKLLDIILGGGIVDLEHTEDPICPLDITAHPIKAVGDSA
jgi:hypothetical protein